LGGEDDLKFNITQIIDGVKVNVVKYNFVGTCSNTNFNIWING